MSILVDNGGYALTNLGDLAMLQATSARLREFIPGDDLEVITLAPDRLEALMPGAKPVSPDGRLLFHQESNLFGAARRLAWRGSRRLGELEAGIRRRWPRQSAAWAARRLGRRGVDVRPMNDYLRVVSEARAVIATGGGYLTDEWELEASRVLETLRIAKSLGKPIALFGQGIGRIESPRFRRLAAAVLRSADLIALREGRLGPPLLRSLGVPPDRVVVTGDDAVELAYDLRPSRPGDAIGFNLRVVDYSGVGTAEAQTVRDVVRRFAEGRAPVLPVPISVGGYDSDVRALTEVLSLNGEAGSAFTALSTADDIIRLVGRCRLVVTGSYHAGVFALSQGIPVVGLAKSAFYRGKFFGLAEQFGRGCEVVVLDDGALVDTLEGAMRRLWDAADSVTDPLLRAAERQAAASREVYRRFAQLLDSEGPPSRRVVAPMSRS